MAKTNEWLLLRLVSARDSTLGILFYWMEGFGWVFSCFTLEDEKRKTLVRGETRIIEGRYELKLRTIGEMHAQYAKKFPQLNFHRGMVEITNVPDRTALLFHIGNSPKDSSGCVLMGLNATSKGMGEFSIGDSRIAYETVYPKLRDSILAGPTFLRISDINGDDALAIAEQLSNPYANNG